MRANCVSLTSLLTDVVDNRGRSAPLADSGIALIATNCIKPESLYPVFEKVRYVSPETHMKWFRGHPKPGDIIIVNKGTPGLTALVPDPVDFAIAQDMVAVRADETKVDPKYLFAYMRSPEFAHQVSALHVGTLIPHLKKSHFHLLEIPIPPRATQQEIGHLYFKFSQKINLNRRMNATLEEMARALFQSWFVNFDPVWAKAEGRPTGLPADIDALFPDSFVDSPLGPIPEGWEPTTIGEQCQVCGGGTPSTTEPAYWDGDHAWATPRDMSRLTAPVLLSTERRVTDEGLAKISSGLLPVGTVLLTSRAPIGYLAVAKTPVAINQGFIALKESKTIKAPYIINWLEANMEAIKDRSNGSTFMEISKSNFRPIPMVLPAARVLEAFDAGVSPLYDQVCENVKESERLAETRDYLLPKLLSGELEVAGLETTSDGSRETSC